MFTPLHYKIVSGVGLGKYELIAFDAALQNAGIGNFNLVKVSSVLPPKAMYCEDIPKEYGSIMYTAYASLVIKYGESGQTAVAVAVPQNSSDNGVIFEYSSKQGGDAEAIVEAMCIEAMADRKLSILQIIKSSQDISGTEDMFTAAISAVVMW